MRNRVLFVLAAVVIVTGLGAPAITQAQDRLQVVASTTIIADVAHQVAGDAADVVALMPPDADPHSYQPAPQDVVALAEADVVLINGANFEEGLMETIQNAGDEMNTVVVSQCVDILPFGLVGTHAHDHDATSDGSDQASTATPAPADTSSAIAEQCAAHHAALDAMYTESVGDTHDHGTVEPLGMLYTLECSEHDQEAEGEEHEHEVGSCDPHVWFDPHNVMLWTLMIRDTLSDLDPANADLYAANAAAYLDTLDALAQHDIPDLLADLPADQRILVTDHDALGYYANAYGFEIVGVVIPSSSTLAEASAGELAALIDSIKAEGVLAIFAGTTINPDLSQQVADEAGAAFYTLYTGSLSDSDGPAASYVDLLRYDTSTIVNALRP